MENARANMLLQDTTRKAAKFPTHALAARKKFIVDVYINISLEMYNSMQITNLHEKSRPF